MPHSSLTIGLVGVGLGLGWVEVGFGLRLGWGWVSKVDWLKHSSYSWITVVIATLQDTIVG